DAAGYQLLADSLGATGVIDPVAGSGSFALAGRLHLPRDFFGDGATVALAADVTLATHPFSIQLANAKAELKDAKIAGGALTIQSGLVELQQFQLPAGRADWSVSFGCAALLSGSSLELQGAFDSGSFSLSSTGAITLGGLVLKQASGSSDPVLAFTCRA